MIEDIQHIFFFFFYFFISAMMSCCVLHARYAHGMRRFLNLFDYILTKNLDFWYIKAWIILEI